MNDSDQLETIRELLRDALEVARTAGAATSDSAAQAVWQRGRDGIATVLGEFDDFASRADRPRAT